MELISVILGTHFLSDWIAQPRSIAKRKSSSWKWMGIHLLIIQTFWMIPAIVYHVPQWAVLLNTISHLVIDKTIWTSYVRYRGPLTLEWLQANKYAEDDLWYVCIALDQFLHLSIVFYIFMCVWWYA